MEYIDIYYDKRVAKIEDAILLETSEGGKWIPRSVIYEEKFVDYTSGLFVQVERWFAEKEGFI